MTNKPAEVDDGASWVGLLSFTPTKVLEWLMNSPCKITCLFTGNQFGKCAGTLTMIETPSGEVSMGELYANGLPFYVYAWDGNKKVIALAEAPFKKEGIHKCYRITMSDGRFVDVADRHRILTSSGYVFASTLAETFLSLRQTGDGEISPSLHQTTLESCPSVHVVNDQSYVGTPLSFLDCCSDNYHQYDDKLLMARDTDQVSVPLQSCVLLRNFYCVLRRDVLGKIHANIQQLKCDLLFVVHLFLDRISEFLSETFYRDILLCAHGPQIYLQHVVELGDQPLSSALKHQCQPISKPSYYPPISVSGKEIVNIESIPSQEVYDFTVPKYHNYIAAGMVHHNTDSIAVDFTMRILGIHPNVTKRIKPEDRIRTFRFASQTLPSENTEGEVRNTQYPAFKRRFPSSLMEKDITARKAVVTVKAPVGDNIQIEYVSFSQDTQAGAGVQRRCLAQGQRILKTNGIWEEIENIEVGDELICEAIGGRSDRQRTNKVKDIKCTGEKDVYKVSCQKGLSFIATEDHRMMVASAGCGTYKSIGELKVGDSLKAKLPIIYGTKTIEDWLIKWVASLIGDGHTGENGIFITAKNKIFIDDLTNVLIGSIKQVRYEKHGTPQYKINSKELKKYLEESGLYGKKAGEKFIPRDIFTQDDKTIRLFLRYLYATDGWASGKSIGYCSTSERLSDDLFLLLRRLGIRSNKYTKTFTNKWNKQYWIIIAQSRDAIKFLSEIGIAHKDNSVTNVLKEAKRRYSEKGGKNILPVKKSVLVKKIEYIGKKITYDIQMESGGWDYREKNGIKTQRIVARSPRNNFLIQGGLVSHNSCWIDEECSKDFFEEQVPRLLAADGDIIFTFTPVPGAIGWEFDSLYERARIIYRTEAVRKRIKERYGEDVPEMQITDSSDDICVIMAATDDNPIYEELAKQKSKITGIPTTAKEYIDSLFAMYDDEDIVDARRYGLFRQLSGRVFKSFDPHTHVIKQDTYFPQGIPDAYKFARGIDHHESNPWAVVWLGISPQDEIFVWCDASAKTNNITYDIALNIAHMSGDHKYLLDLIDPNAAKKQNSTNFSTIDDLNRYFNEFRNQNICRGGHWQSWETHGTRGREEFTKRLLNSIKVGKPFNNKVIDNGRTVYLPTIWITDNCKYVIESMRNWRYEEWASRETMTRNDPKEKPQMKFSHFPLAIECLLKSPLITRTHFGPYNSEVSRPKYYAKGVLR